METVPALRYPPPATLRLSRESLNIFDEIAAELGGISRRAAVEIVARYVRGLKDKNGSYSSLLISSPDESLPQPPSPKGRRAL